MPFLGHFATQPLSEPSEIFAFFRFLVSYFECLFTNGLVSFSVSEALQKGEGGWIQDLHLELTVLCFPFRQTTL
jgi:hypothetical protein